MKKIKRSIESFLEWCYDYDGIILVIPIIIVPILLAFTVFSVHCYNLSLQNGTKYYNNGICRECGGSFEYKGSSRDGCYRYDYYICPNGHIIEVFKG